MEINRLNEQIELKNDQIKLLQDKIANTVDEVEKTRVSLKLHISLILFPSFLSSIYNILILKFLNAACF